PIIGAVTQPTCTTPTGSVVLSGLPSSGTWTITGTPSGSKAGTGTSTTMTGLAPNQIYTFTVTNNSRCVSVASANVTINAIPSNPILGGTDGLCLHSTKNVKPSSGDTWSSNNGNLPVTNGGLVTANS